MKQTVFNYILPLQNVILTNILDVDLLKDSFYFSSLFVWLLNSLSILHILIYNNRYCKKNTILSINISISSMIRIIFQNLLLDSITLDNVIHNN